MSLIFVFLFGLLSCSLLSDWNFQGLASSTYYEYQYSSTFTYRFNFRTALPTDSAKNCASVGCVVEEISTTYCYCCGNLSSETVDIFPDDSAINFTYHSNTPSGGSTHGHFTLRCADTLSYSASYSGWDIYVNISAPQGCKGWEPEGADGGKKKKGGITFGGVFFIILLILVFLYFAIGIPISYFVFHKTGVELFVPGFPIIMMILACIKAGVIFIFQSIKGLVTGQKGMSGGTMYSSI